MTVVMITNQKGETQLNLKVGRNALTSHGRSTMEILRASTAGLSCSLVWKVGRADCEAGMVSWLTWALQHAGGSHSQEGP